MHVLLRSDDGSCSLEVVRTVGDPDHFTVHLSLGDIALENDYVVFLDPVSFMEQLRGVAETRHGTALLSGTEEFQLRLEPDGGSGALAVDIILNRQFVASLDRNGHPRTAKATLKGVFTVSGEYVQSMVEGFYAVFR